MGKGTIQNHIAGGQYSVEIELDTTGIATEITRIDNKIADINNQLSGMEEGLEKSILELKKTALEKRKEYLENPLNVPVNSVENLWCADLTDDLSGDVGVIEIAGLRADSQNIQPGHEENAVYDGNRDGKLKPAIASSATGIYFNWAMRGGWQKWKPTFRLGTITEIDKNLDTCTVQLDDEINPDSGLNVNKMAELSNVPIEYMDCNAVAFAVDDEVIVKFENNNWNSPKVIGFKSEPNRCAWEPWDSDGNDLCANHDWKVYTALTNNVLCPALPIHDVQHLGATSDLDIVDGVLKASVTSAQYSYNDTLLLTWQDSPTDPAKVANTLRLKISANLLNATTIYDYGIIYLYENESPYYSALFYFACGDPGSIALPGYYIGDNGGEEQSLTLTDYGYSPDAVIGAVQIDVFMNWPATLTYDLDYIHFS